MYDQIRRVVRARARFEEAWRSEVEATGIPFRKVEP